MFCCPGKSLVIILDNVDKYEPTVVNQAFLRNADLFREVDSHLVFTIQSSLLHNPVEDAVDQSFRTFVLPMMPIFIKGTRGNSNPRSWSECARPFTSAYPGISSRMRTRWIVSSKRREVAGAICCACCRKLF